MNSTFVPSERLTRATLGSASVLLLALAGVGCDSLDVENPNNPDRERALAQANDLQALIAGSFVPWFAVTHENAAVQNVWTVVGGESTAVGRLVDENAAEPRPAFRNQNVPAAPTDNGNNLWRGLHRMPATAYDGLRTISDLGITLREGSVDVTPRARAFAKFSQGLGWGYAAVVYDKVVVVPETQELTASPVQQALDNLLSAQEGPRSPAIAAAVAALDSARAIAQRGNVTFPSASVSGPGRWFGTPATLTTDQFVRLTNTLAARLLVLSARTPQQRAQVDWDKVLAYTANGLTSDFELVLASGVRTSPLYGRVQNDQPGCEPCHRVDNRLAGLADVSGAYQAWLARPVDQRDRFLITTPDRRITGPTPTSNGAYVRYLDNNNGFPTALGHYHRSSYQWHRHLMRGFQANTGTAKIATVDENTLLRAEAMLHKGDLDGAAALVNITRTRSHRVGDVTYPGLPPVTRDGVPAGPNCVPRTDSGACGDLLVALRYERMLELLYLDAIRGYADSRGFGLLPNGSFLQAPIIPIELEVLGLENYTFGGVGDTWGAVYRPVTMANFRQ